MLPARDAPRQKCRVGSRFLRNPPCATRTYQPPLWSELFPVTAQRNGPLELKNFVVKAELWLLPRGGSK